MARGQVDGFRVDAEHAVEFVLRHLLQRLGQMRDARVVDEDVEVSEFGERGLGDLGHVRIHADISGEPGATQHVRHRLRRLGVQVGDHHARAIIQDTSRDAGPETRGATGDKRGLSVEAHRCLRFDPAVSFTRRPVRRKGQADNSPDRTVSP